MLSHGGNVTKLSTISYADGAARHGGTAGKWYG